LTREPLIVASLFGSESDPPPPQAASRARRPLARAVRIRGLCKVLVGQFIRVSWSSMKSMNRTVETRAFRVCGGLVVSVA
jgi:hypothetical protein